MFREKIIAAVVKNLEKQKGINRDLELLKCFYMQMKSKDRMEIARDMLRWGIGRLATGNFDDIAMIFTRLSRDTDIGVYFTMNELKLFVNAISRVSEAKEWNMVEEFVSAYKAFVSLYAYGNGFTLTTDDISEMQPGNSIHSARKTAQKIADTVENMVNILKKGNIAPEFVERGTESNPKSNVAYVTEEGEGVYKAFYLDSVTYIESALTICIKAIMAGREVEKTINREVKRIRETKREVVMWYATEILKNLYKINYKELSIAEKDWCYADEAIATAIMLAKQGKINEANEIIQRHPKAIESASLYAITQMEKLGIGSVAASI